VYKRRFPLRIVDSFWCVLFRGVWNESFVWLDALEVDWNSITCFMCKIHVCMADSVMFDAWIRLR
jgi:hypothetical protein